MYKCLNLTANTNEPMSFYFLVKASDHFGSSYIGLKALNTLHSQVQQFQRQDF